MSGWLETMVETYGTMAVFLGTTLEGEAVAIAGGVMAHREHLSFWPVALAAAGGGYLSDLVIYGLGQKYKDSPAFAECSRKRESGCISCEVVTKSCSVCANFQVHPRDANCGSGGFGYAWNAALSVLPFHRSISFGLGCYRRYAWVFLGTLD